MPIAFAHDRVRVVRGDVFELASVHPGMVQGQRRERVGAEPSSEPQALESSAPRIGNSHPESQAWDLMPSTCSASSTCIGSAR